MKKAAMFRTTIFLPDQVHRDLRMLSARSGRSMAKLILDSVLESYKRDLADIRAADEAMREHRRRPASAVDARGYFVKRR